VVRRLAARRRELPGEELEQDALACAVLADDADALAPKDRQVDLE